MIDSPSKVLILTLDKFSIIVWYIHCCVNCIQILCIFLCNEFCRIQELLRRLLSIHVEARLSATRWSLVNLHQRCRQSEKYQKVELRYQMTTKNINIYLGYSSCTASLGNGRIHNSPQSPCIYPCSPQLVHNDPQCYYRWFQCWDIRSKSTPLQQYVIFLKQQFD